MKEIKVLDPVTISKIAAGEIIENPASVVKELVENAIDAEAKNILIEVKGSPSEFLMVRDDGVGIVERSIKTAFLRHSTSKLTSAEDLYNIYTLGFRGEALASISHVSKVELMTKTEDATYGIKTTVEEGKFSPFERVGMPRGTTIVVRELFYNTPVRKKYLKSDSLEHNNILDTLQKINLANPSISIKYIRDGRVSYNSKGRENIEEHLYSILGGDISRNLVNFKYITESYKINGFISNNKLYRSTKNHQYIIVNGRYVKNPEISRAIDGIYYSIIPINRYPVFVLYLEIDPILIDVNIHPKKNEVKLSNQNHIIEILSREVRKVIGENRTIPKIEREEILKPMDIFEIYEEKKSIKSPQINHTQFEPIITPKIDTPIKKIDNLQFAMEEVEEYAPVIKEEPEESKIDNFLLRLNYIGTAFKTYIILEGEGKVYLIDQHAAHERIMYERLIREYNNGKVVRQLLLSPELIELQPNQRENLESNRELFEKLGFVIEDFGLNKIVLREVPYIFGIPSYTSIIYDILDSLDSINSSYEANLYKVMRMACRAAVKAGDNLSKMEVDSLIESLIKCSEPYTCPHGRPTIVEVSKREIERLFLRG